MKNYWKCRLIHLARKINKKKLARKSVVTQHDVYGPKHHVNKHIKTFDWLRFTNGSIMFQKSHRNLFAAKWTFPLLHKILRKFKIDKNITTA